MAEIGFTNLTSLSPRSMRGLQEQGYHWVYARTIDEHFYQISADPANERTTVREVRAGRKARYGTQLPDLQFVGYLTREIQIAREMPKAKQRQLLDGTRLLFGANQELATFEDVRAFMIACEQKLRAPVKEVEQKPVPPTPQVRQGFRRLSDTVTAYPELTYTIVARGGLHGVRFYVVFENDNVFEFRYTTLPPRSVYDGMGAAVRKGAYWPGEDYPQEGYKPKAHGSSSWLGEVKHILASKESLRADEVLALCKQAELM